jgi:hypothetical protein
MDDPHTDDAGADPVSDRVRDAISDRVSEDLAALSNLIAAGVEVDGEIQVAESTWAIYGHTSHDGEIIVGEYGDAVEASEVLRAAPRAHPDDRSP